MASWPPGRDRSEPSGRRLARWLAHTVSHVCVRPLAARRPIGPAGAGGLVMPRRCSPPPPLPKWRYEAAPTAARRDPGQRVLKRHGRRGGHVCTLRGWRRQGAKGQRASRFQLSEVLASALGRSPASFQCALCFPLLPLRPELSPGFAPSPRQAPGRKAFFWPPNSARGDGGARERGGVEGPCGAILAVSFISSVKQPALQPERSAGRRPANGLAGQLKQKRMGKAQGSRRGSAGGGHSPPQVDTSPAPAPDRHAQEPAGR